MSERIEIRSDRVGNWIFRGAIDRITQRRGEFRQFFSAKQHQYQQKNRHHFRATHAVDEIEEWPGEIG